MSCPHSLSTYTSKRKYRTSLGYRTFFCSGCGRRFNERTGSPFNDLLPDRHRLARCSLAFEIQAQFPRCGRAALITRVLDQPRDDPGLGVPIRTVD